MANSFQHIRSASAGTHRLPLMAAGLRASRMAILAVIATIAGLALWFAPMIIGGSVIAPGMMQVESETRSVQHFGGGTITEIRVGEGDEVSAGDTLIVLDSVRLRDQINSLNAQIGDTAARIRHLTEEQANLTDLAERGLATRTRMIALERELVATKRGLTRLIAERVSREMRLSQKSVIAPISGTVHDLAFSFIGATVAPGQDIMTIVPKPNELVLTARLDPSDINDVEEWQKAWIRLPGMRTRRSPDLSGTVIGIADDMSYDEISQDSFYEVTIRLDDSQPSEFDARNLQPGMPADALIRTEPRTIMSNLLRPLSGRSDRMSGYE